MNENLEKTEETNFWKNSQETITIIDSRANDGLDHDMGNFRGVDGV